MFKTVLVKAHAAQPCGTIWSQVGHPGSITIHSTVDGWEIYCGWMVDKSCVTAFVPTT